MSRISEAFEKKAFVGFITAGDPCVEKTEEFIGRMIDAGTDLVEIGIPFSDPIAEGPVIQGANVRALNAGTKLEHLFGLVKNLRKKYNTPICFMTYINPVYRYGAEKFFSRCKEAGVDGIIIPDMPFEEKDEIQPFANAHGIEVISLIAPTSEERIKLIASEAQGFVYVVSSMGVTGIRSEFNTNIKDIVGEVKKHSNVPVAVGFGINTPQQAKDFSQFSDGVIVGSGIVRIVEEHGENAGDYIYGYVKAMKDAMTEK